MIFGAKQLRAIWVNLFFGDESYNMDEIDREGFDGLDDLPDTQEEIDLY